MKGIPPEIDQLMWTLAEEGNQSAQDEFVRRYPTYRQELLHRLNTLSGLKTGRPKTVATPAKPMPRFVPKEKVAPAAPRGIYVGVGALALAALALASYTVTSMLAPATSKPTHYVDDGYPPTSSHHSGQPEEGNEAPLPSGQNSSETPAPSLNDLPPESVPPVDDTPKYNKPQSLVVKRAGLVNVLQMLGASSGLKVVVAPGMPDPTIAVEYHDATPMEILRDLGHRYGFTPFDQGDGSVVVYPVVEKGRAQPERHLG